MKRLIVSALAAGLLLALAVPASQAQAGKIAGVNLKKLFDDYWKTKQANNNLQAQREDILKERTSLTDKLKKTEEDYKQLLESANDQAVSAEEREKRKKSAENKLVEYRQTESATEQFLRNAASTLQETEARMRNNIVKELREAVEAKAKAAGYMLVIDSSADTPVGTPVFLYATVEDLTEVLTKELNAKAPPGALDERPKTSPTNAPAPPK